MKRPFIIATTTLSASGVPVSEPGIDLACPEDRWRVHSLREIVKAVAVGRGVWDKGRRFPQAHKRHLGRPPRRQPTCVLFAGERPVFVRETPAPLVVVGQVKSVAPGCQVTTVPAAGRDLRASLEELRAIGIRTLLVEGGRVLLKSFLTQGMVDLTMIYVASPDPSQAAAVARQALPWLPTDTEVAPRACGTLFTFWAPAITGSGGGGRSCALPTSLADFRMTVFRIGGSDHIALTLGDLRAGPPPLVRVHSECLTGDVFGSTRCDCGPQLQHALRQIRDVGRGAVIYLRQEGRGIGLLGKAKAYHLQDDAGFDTLDANLALGYPADARDYAAAATILQRLGVSSVRLLSNNPAKAEGLRAAGITVVERAPLVTPPTSRNLHYLQTKVLRMAHDSALVDVVPLLPS